MTPSGFFNPLSVSRALSRSSSSSDASGESMSLVLLRGMVENRDSGGREAIRSNPATSRPNLVVIMREAAPRRKGRDELGGKAVAA